MPIYEYECRKCNAHIEVMQKMADKPLVKCTKCGGRLEKQWSSTSFQLKGTGWYVTDYAAKKAEVKTESKETKTSTTEDKSSKTDDKTSKKDSSIATSKKDDTTSDKEPSTSKKNSRTPSPNTSGD